MRNVGLCAGALISLVLIGYGAFPAQAMDCCCYVQTTQWLSCADCTASACACESGVCTNYADCNGYFDYAVFSSGVALVWVHDDCAMVGSCNASLPPCFINSQCTRSVPTFVGDMYRPIPWEACP
jgi:hypothetical protein